MRARAPSLGLLCFVMVFGLVGLAACGGSSDSSSTSSSSTSTTTKAAATSSDDEIATAASIQVADLGAGWTEYQKASAFKAATKNSCIVKFGSPLTASDQVYFGPIARDATKQAFVYSSVVVFETDSQAKAYSAVRNSQEFKDCKEAEDDAAQKKRDPKAFTRLGDTASPALKDGLEAFYQEEAGVKGTDGTDVVTADFSRYTVRKGQVVYTVSVDTNLPTDAAARTALGESVTTGLNAGLAVVTARLDVLDV